MLGLPLRAFGEVREAASRQPGIARAAAPKPIALINPRRSFLSLIVIDSAGVGPSVSGIDTRALFGQGKGIVGCPAKFLGGLVLRIVRTPHHHRQAHSSIENTFYQDLISI